MFNIILKSLVIKRYGTVGGISCLIIKIGISHVNQLVSRNRLEIELNKSMIFYSHTIDIAVTNEGMEKYRRDS